ncbi:hypothetical protein BDW75DRAFT_113343 [Aspergillus navahoensis]
MRYPIYRQKLRSQCSHARKGRRLFALSVDCVVVLNSDGLIYFTPQKRPTAISDIPVSSPAPIRRFTSKRAKTVPPAAQLAACPPSSTPTTSALLNRSLTGHGPSSASPLGLGTPISSPERRPSS